MEHSSAKGRRGNHRGEAGRLLAGLGIILGIVGLAMVGGAFTFGGTASGQAEKVIICHFDRNNQGPNAGPHTIEVDDNAVAQHLENHTKNKDHIGDDHLGACEVTPTATATSTATSAPTSTATSTATAIGTATATATATEVTAAVTIVPATETPVLEEAVLALPTATATPVTAVEGVAEVAPVQEVAGVARLPVTGGGGSSSGSDLPVPLGLGLIALGGALFVASRRLTRTSG